MTRSLQARALEWLFNKINFDKRQFAKGPHVTSSIMVGLIALVIGRFVFLDSGFG